MTLIAQQNDYKLDWSQNGEQYKHNAVIKSIFSEVFTKLFNYKMVNHYW